MFKSTRTSLTRTLAGATALAAIAVGAAPAFAGASGLSACDASLAEARALTSASVSGAATDVDATVARMHDTYEADAKARLAAYGTAIDSEAASFEKVGAAVEKALGCYGAAEAKLAAMPADKRADKLAMIRKGTEEAGTLLNTAMAAISKSITTYDKALLVETNSEGVNLATINRLAYLGRVNETETADATTAEELNKTQPAAGSMFLTLASLAALSEADPMAVEVGIATGTESSVQAVDASTSEWTVSQNDMQEMKAADMLDQLQAAGRSSEKLLQLYDRTRATLATQQSLAAKLSK